MYVIAAALKAQTKMAQVVATLKIMPKSPETDLHAIEKEARKKISQFSGNNEIKAEQEPIAFGLTALKLMFVMDEAKGSPDSLETSIRSIKGVNSAETIDVRRAIG